MNEFLSFFVTLLATYLVIVILVLSLCFGTCKTLLESFGRILLCRRRPEAVAANAGPIQSRNGQLFQGREHQNDCCICLGELGNDKVAAMCGHRFCSKCIMDYWRSKGQQTIKCPQCSRHITFFAAYDESSVQPSLLEDIRRFNNTFSSDRTFLDSMKDMPFLLERLIEEVRASHGGVLLQNYRILAVLLGTLGYAISPIDLIPDLFGVIGVMDDALIVMYGGVTIASFFYNILVERNN